MTTWCPALGQIQNLSGRIYCRINLVHNNPTKRSIPSRLDLQTQTEGIDGQVGRERPLGSIPHTGHSRNQGGVAPGMAALPWGIIQIYIHSVINPLSILLGRGGGGEERIFVSTTGNMED